MKNLALPFSKADIESIATDHPTPFHLYDERAIRENARRFLEAFDWCPGFREFFAVKATPNPHLLEIMRDEGFGADCSSFAELTLADCVGLRGEQIMFSSNETPAAEFIKAKSLDAIINLDDLTHLEFLEKVTGLPKLISFRFNPGPARTGNAIIGNPVEAKFGLTREQLFEGYSEARRRGVERFGLHTMVISNELHGEYFLETARMLFELAVELHADLGIRLEFVNLGGGIGIPYRPDESPIDVAAFGSGVRQLYEQMIVANGLDPMRIFLESGRYFTGPYGYLITRAIHKKAIYKQYVGVDACMAHLMRPGMYGAYHHITVLGKEGQTSNRVYDVVGSLCENNDKFAVDRELPEIDINDLLVVHDTGAHGHAMGFNYNGKLRSAELLLRENGEVQQIRRAETEKDLFATLDYPGLT